MPTKTELKNQLNTLKAINSGQAWELRQLLDANKRLEALAERQAERIDELEAELEAMTEADTVTIQRTPEEQVELEVAHLEHRHNLLTDKVDRHLSGHDKREARRARIWSTLTLACWATVVAWWIAQ